VIWWWCCCGGLDGWKFSGYRCCVEVARFVCCGAPVRFGSSAVQWGFGVAAILDSGCGCGGRGVIGGV
jgi:hypothetical protein